MANKSPSYWQQRFSDLENAQNQYGQRTYHQIEGAFDKAQREIQSQIETWYSRYATNNGISMAEARKQLTAAELKELRWDVEEYIKYGQQNALNQQWMKELENASARFHISRLEALKLRSQNALEVAFGNEADAIDGMLKHLYQDGYYRTCFEIQKGFNIGWGIGQIDEKKLQKVISKPWAADGKSFSERVWQSRTTMIGELHQQLTRTIIQGKAPDQAIEHMTNFLNNKTKNAKYQAGRLVMTEQAFISSAAQKDAFNELDVEQFEIVATLDSRTSEICQDMDGKVYEMKDFEPGVTAPPFHCFCRSTTVPYFDDEWGRSGDRAARDSEGNTYYVPSDMKYKDWKKALVGGNGQGLTKIDSIDDLNKQLADKQLELDAIKKAIFDVSDRQDEWQKGKWNTTFNKFEAMSDDEYKKHIDKLRMQEADLTAELQKVFDINDKYYDRPKRGTPEFDEWQKWKDENFTSIDDLYARMDKIRDARSPIQEELKEAEKFNAWKAKFGDMTAQDFQDEVDRLTAKQKAIQKEMDDINQRIKDVQKLQTEAAYSAKSLQEIKDVIMKNHETILKSDIHKKEFDEIISSMDKDHANLYEKMSHNFSKSSYNKGSGFYSPYGKRIEMNLSSNAWDKRMERSCTGAWKTKFHEEMHQLDHMLASSKSHFALLDGTTDQYYKLAFTNTKSVYGKKMIAAIDDDIVDLINKAIDWDGGKINHIKSLGRIPSEAKSTIIKYLKEHYKTPKARASIDTVTDAIGLTTNAKIHPYSHGFWGHSKSYSSSNGKDGATSEAWANLAGFMMRGDKEALDAVSAIMPRTVKTYQDIFDEVIEYAKSNDIKY